MAKSDTKTEPGLYLFGEVVARKRREAKTAAGASRFLVSLFIRTNTGVLQADRWADHPLPGGTPDVGASIMLPVAATAFMSHGVAVSRLTWGGDEGGSDF
jgi:hypothetical protein